MLLLSRIIGQSLRINKSLLLDMTGLSKDIVFFEYRANGEIEKHECKLGNFFRLNSHVKIYVNKINGNQAQIGIDAVREIPVVREEVYQRNTKNKSTTEPDMDQYWENIMEHFDGT